MPSCIFCTKHYENKEQGAKWVSFEGKAVCVWCVAKLRNAEEEQRDSRDEKIHGRRKLPLYTLFRLPAHDKPIHMVVTTYDYLYSHKKESWPSEKFAESQKYYFEEHTCPTNFTGFEVIADSTGNMDPHGIFEFVRSVPKEEPPRKYEERFWAKLFPEMVKGTEWEEILCEVRDDGQS